MFGRPECPSCHLELQETRGTNVVLACVWLATFVLLTWLLGEQRQVSVISAFAVLTAVRLLFGRWRERVPRLTTLHLH